MKIRIFTMLTKRGRCKLTKKTVYTAINLVLLSMAFFTSITLFADSAMGTEEAYVKVVPASASVGTPFREIMVYVEAWDPPAIGVISTDLYAENVPSGVSLWFDPPGVDLNNYIESKMYINVGTAAPGTYTIAIWARWIPLGYPLNPPWYRTCNFILTVFEAAEAEWTANSDWIRAEGKWEGWAFCWNWVNWDAWKVPNSGGHFALWPYDGVIELMATDDHNPLEWCVGSGAQFGQGSAYPAEEPPSYQPTPLNLNPLVHQVTMRAAVNEDYGSIIVPPQPCRGQG